MSTASTETSRIGDVLMLRDDATGAIVAKHLKTGTRMRLARARGHAPAREPSDGDQLLLGKLANLVEQRAAAIAPRRALITLPIGARWIARGEAIARWPWRWPWTAGALAAAGTATIIAALDSGLPAPQLRGITALDWLLIAAVHGVLLVCHEIAHAILLLRWGGRPRWLKLLVAPGVLMAVDAGDLYALPRVTQRVQVVLAGPCVDAAAVIALYWVQSALGEPWSILLWLQGILLVVGLWPFAYTDGYVLVAAVFDTPGLNRVSRDCLTSLLTGRAGLLRAEASVRGWPAIAALCGYAAGASVGRWLPIPILIWLLFPYLFNAVRGA